MPRRYGYSVAQQRERRTLALKGAAGVAAIGLFGLALAANAWAQGPQPPAAFPAPPAAAAPSPAPSITLRPDQIEVLEKTLAAADTHGFEPGEFLPAKLESLLQSSDPITRQLGQGELVEATLRYARAVHVGRLPQAAFMDDWGMKPPPYDPAPELARAVTQNQLQAWLDGLPPPYTGYDSLRQGLTTYRSIAARGGWTPISAGPPLKVGDKGPRVLELRARLWAEDPSAPLAPTPPLTTPDVPAPPVVNLDASVFDAPLESAVMRAQKRFGLKDDGVVDRLTLTALNIPVAERIDQIVANMERWRWLPPVLPVDRIQVNVAAAILTVFHADSPTLSMRAVTGRPGDETPMLQSQVESIVLNPPWNVPSSIAQKELFPKEKANPGYFAAHDFVLVPTPEGGQRLVQKAGSQAALGKIKFDFPNTYGVYLHDTPSRSAFDRFGRLASHGCVRLQKPLVLAKAVMEGDPVWTPEAIDATLASGKTVRAPLSRPIAVFLFYWTAYVTPDGQVNFRGDPYGWDEELVDRIHATEASAGAA